MVDPVLRKRRYERAKNLMIVEVAAKAATSNYPEYYKQAANLLDKIPSYKLCAVLLSVRYSRKEVIEMTGLTKSTVDSYVADVVELIRREIDPDLIIPHTVVLPYYLGMIDVDILLKAYENYM